MGNVPISCCRSKSPIDSESRTNNGTSNKYSSSGNQRRKVSKAGVSGYSQQQNCDNLSSIHQHQSSHILQHISEREPDDSETDPSSNLSILGQNNALTSDCRRKASSCSTIFIDNSTISQPDLEETIKCVSLALYYHIKNRNSNVSSEIFDETIHPLKIPSDILLSDLSQEGDWEHTSVGILYGENSTTVRSADESKISHNKNNKEIEISQSTSQSTSDMPNQRDIYEFVNTLFEAAHLTSEYAITTLVYLERLMTYAEMDLTPKTWRRMFLGALLLSSKVWEDQAVWNVDYAQILEEISVDDINELERQFLELIQFNMNVPSSVYAKYYYHLRTLAMKNGLGKVQSLLSVGKARKLEAMSRFHTAEEWLSSPIQRKSPPSVKKHTSLERLRDNGHGRAVLM